MKKREVVSEITTDPFARSSLLDSDLQSGVRVFPPKMKSQKKRKRSPEMLTREEREGRIWSLKKEMDGLLEFYREVMDRKLDVKASDSGAVNSAIAVLLEESKLPLSKLVEEIYDKVKEMRNGCGVTPATVKASVVSVGQRVMYGVPNPEVDILEDDSHSCLWCWETRDVKLMPGSVRGALKIRRICRKKIQERITAIYELMAILQKDESSQNYKSDLLKVSEKLGKLLNEADIRTFVNSMMQKNGANIAEKEAKQEEKLLIKQLEKKMHAAEKEKKRLDCELHKEKWQSEREQKQLQEEAERCCEKEESEMRRQLRKQKEEAEKDQRRREREEAGQKKKLAIQKQASIMEQFLRRNKNDSSHQNNLSLTKTITSDSLVQKSEKTPDTVTVSMDRALSSNNEIDSQYMLKSHILSWRCLGQSIRSNHKTWGQRQKPKTELFKELKLTTSKELACDDELNMEKLVVGQGATGDKPCHSVADASISSVKKCKQRKQLLQFDKSHRPPFYGVWPKKSHIIGPHHPLRQDPEMEYEIDSDEEWEEEEPGESLSDCDEDDEGNSEEGCLKAGDEEESDYYFFVPDGYLSENEGVEVDRTKIDCAVDERVILPGCKQDLESEEFNVFLRQQKYLYNVTDHALRKNQPLMISNLMHEKVQLIDAKDLASTPKLEQTCLQALSMRSFPGGIPIEILEDTVQSENEDASQSFPKGSSTPTSAAIRNLDLQLPAFVSTIQSCSQGIDKVVKSLHNKFPGTSKSQLRNKVREISDFVDNRWQVKKDILDKLGMSNSPEKSGKRTKGIAAFFSKRCLPPAAAAAPAATSMNPTETSPQKPPASHLVCKLNQQDFSYFQDQ